MIRSCVLAILNSMATESAKRLINACDMSDEVSASCDETMYSRSSMSRDLSVEETYLEHDELFTDSEVDRDRMRRKLRYFFMSPCDKYTAKRRVPFKLILQVIKIAVVTFQLVMFGLDAETHASFVEKNIVSFKHLYLKDWDTTLETMPYPPTRGTFAVYTYKELFEAVDFLLKRYNSTLELALGSYDFATKPAPYVKFCREYYQLGKIFAPNQSYEFSDVVLWNCTDVTPVTKADGEKEYNFMQFVTESGINLNFDSILHISFHFSLKSVNLRSIDMDQQPDCYRFNVSVLYDNALHSGEVAVSLTAAMETIEPCRGQIYHRSEWGFVIRVLLVLFDVVVIAICVMSLALCIRSLHNASRMRLLAIRFFRAAFGHSLSRSDRGAFIDMWLVLIIVSDLFVIMGSLIKLLTDNSVTDNFQTGGVAFGIGVCFVWCGILRYLGFFTKYNILLRVLSVAMPSLLRFLVCAGVLFAGFTLCGWVVIGPYHVKFRSVESTAACLFSLLNGDDMYVTFSGVPKSRNLFAYVFNYVYLIIFISLFIYAVLNVFITIIIDAYEVMKEGDEVQDSFMWNFMRQRSQRSNSRQYRRDEQDEDDCNIARSCSDLFHRCCCCCPKIGSDDEESNASEAGIDESTPLILHGDR